MKLRGWPWIGVEHVWGCPKHTYMLNIYVGGVEHEWEEERVVKIPSLQGNATGLTTRGLSSRQGVPREENKALGRCVGRRRREKTWVFLREREKEFCERFEGDVWCIYRTQDRRFWG